MNYLNNTIVLVAALLAGLIAGLFYAYSCSVNIGLAKLPDLQYLRVMQSINIAIQNPVFFLSFMGTAIMLPLAAWLSYKAGNIYQFQWQMVAAILYIAATFCVTAFGNVPLNNALAAFNTDTATADSLQQMRRSFETPWNRFHFIRTIASILSFLAMLISLIRFR